MTLDNKEQQVLALAGVFQSAALVQQLARTGELPAPAFSTLVRSIFELDPPNTLAVYGRISDLSMGIDALDVVLRQRDTARYADTIRYTFGLLQIERILNRHEELMHILRVNLEKIREQANYFDNDLCHPGIVTKLGDLYVNTMGTLNFRIQVKGDGAVLQQDDNAARVRTAFLAGVRSALLWRQLGGSRWQFIFSKGKILSALKGLQERAVLEQT